MSLNSIQFNWIGLKFLGNVNQTNSKRITFSVFCFMQLGEQYDGFTIDYHGLFAYTWWNCEPIFTRNNEQTVTTDN